MAISKSFYTYHANQGYGQSLIANIGSDAFASELDELCARLKQTNRLEFIPQFMAFPFDAKQIAIAQASQGFHFDDWVIPAFIWQENSYAILNFLIVNRNNLSWAYVVNAKSLKIMAVIYQKFYVDEGDGPIEFKQFCEDIGLELKRNFEPNRKTKFFDSTPKQEEAKEAESETDFTMPDLAKLKSFSARSGKKPKAILDQDLPVDPKKKKVSEGKTLEDPQKKVDKKPLVPKDPPLEFDDAEEENEDNSEEDNTAAIDAQMRVLNSSAFQPNSSFKPGKIKREEKTKTPQNTPVEFNKPAIQKVFESDSKTKPKQINSGLKRFKTMPFFEYRPNKKVSKPLVVINEHDGPFETLFERVENDLEQVHWLDLNESVAFCPNELPGGDPRYSKLANFDVKEWKLAVLTLDQMNVPTDAALLFKDDPRFAIYLSLRYGIKLVCVATNGFNIKIRPYITFNRLIEMIDERDEAIEEPVVSEASIPKHISDNQSDENIETNLVNENVVESSDLDDAFIKVRTKPRRRLFVTERFRKELEKLCDSHPQAEEDMFELYEQIICSSEEDLQNILSIRDNKNINGLPDVTLRKMRFSNSLEYGASRVFFINGYDSKRRMEPSDFIFVGLSDEDEHDEQGQVARTLARYLKQHEETLLLHKILLPEDTKEDPTELAYLSERQIALLDHTQTRCPIAFSGSAGTGKTLLSMSNYIDLVNNGLTTLYITYQDDLCSFVASTLKQEGQQDPNCMTFRTLCSQYLSPDTINFDNYADRATFREWFLSKAARDRAFKSIIADIGNTDDERFMTSYVFYNGVIRGSADCQGNPDLRLTIDQFLQKTGKEEGYSAQQREAIYQVGVQYDKYLDDNSLLNANDLALKILDLSHINLLYDAIIIDEYQDLTELQFLAIIKLIKSTIPLHLYLYGDDNQSVNPTIFNIGDAERIVKETFNKRVSLNVEYLNDSYRSGTSLVRFINEFNLVKKASIGARKKSIEAPERSLREDNDDLFALLLREEASFRKVIALAAKSNRDTIFVFPEAKICEQAKRKYSKIDPNFVSSSFISVEQAKGREWDTVVLYDFFSSSSELFEAILGEERVGKHSTLHRMLFNRFYVALTRAKNRIIVFEDKRTALVDKKILSHLSVLKNVNEIESYFAGNVDLEHWVEFGNRLFRKKDYEGALRAYGRASEHPAAKQLMLMAERYSAIAKKAYSRAEAVSILLEYKDYNGLSEFYENNAERKKYLLLRQLRNESEPTKDVSRAFVRMDRYCNQEEKEFFFSLAVNRFARDIANEAKKYKEE